MTNVTAYGPYALRCPRCNGVFYWLRRELRLHERIDMPDVLHADGTAPTIGEPMVCGTCGARVDDGIFFPTDAQLPAAEMLAQLSR